MATAAVMAVGSIVSSRAQSKAASRAGAAQDAAARRAEGLASRRYEEQKDLMAGFIDPSQSDWQRGDEGPITGSANLQAAYSGALGPEAQKQAYAQYTESPGVAWAREQGMRGMEADIAASGRGGGSRLRAVSEFNQGMAMQDFGNQFSRLGTVTGTGLTAAGVLGGQSVQMTNQQTSQIQQQGQAQAGAAIGRGKAYASGISGLTSAFGKM